MKNLGKSPAPNFFAMRNLASKIGGVGVATRKVNRLAGGLSCVGGTRLDHRTLFHLQILIQHGRRELCGIEVEGEGALVAEACQEQLAPGG